MFPCSCAFLPVWCGSDQVLELLSSDPWLHQASASQVHLSGLCPLSALVQALEAQLKAHLSAPVPNTKSPTTPRFQKCLTTQEVFSQHQGTCLGLTYCRIPVPDFCAPREEVRDRVSGLSLAWEKQLNSIMGPGDCLMGSLRGLRSTSPSFLWMCAFVDVRARTRAGHCSLCMLPSCALCCGASLWVICCRHVYHMAYVCRRNT